MLKKYLGKYFSSWWMPTTLAGLVLAVEMRQEMVFGPIWLSNALMIAFLVSLVSILVASIVQFATGARGEGAVSLALFVGTGVAWLIAVLIFIPITFGPSEDGFADDLIIPKGIEISEPESRIRESPGGPEDAFQTALLAALEVPGTDDSSITVGLGPLVRLQAKAPDVLRRYLATSPSWRVFKEDGNVCATRRWMIGSHWHFLYGYYGRSDIDCWSKMNIPYFQSRFTLGLSGKPWARTDRDSTRLSVGQTKPLVLSVGNRMHESHCVIDANGVVVEVFEQSDAKERRLTKAALTYLDKELAPLAQDASWKTIQAVVPGGSIRNGSPSFGLRHGSQRGIYGSEIWANPGEPGMVYLKAFEVTRGTPLSVGRLKEYSNEWIGWSDDPSQLFFSNTRFTIFEGDWGKPYAARFEVWFAPTSGRTERKLFEKVFKIEGWQR